MSDEDIPRPNRTIHHAIKDLPPRQQQALLRLWKCAKVADLYDGDLNIYLEVIATQFEESRSSVKALVRVIEKIRKLVYE